MPVPARSGSTPSDAEARWYRQQDSGTPTGRRRFNNLSLGAPPPGGPSDSAFFEAARSPPRRRRGPATALRFSGLLGEAYQLNGDYVIQETGRFRQTTGDGLLVHRSGRWRLSLVNRESDCIASSGPLLGQWSNEHGSGDHLQGPYPYVVATETRDEVSQPKAPPLPPQQRFVQQPQLQPVAPTSGGPIPGPAPPEQTYRAESELSMFPPRNDTVAALQARLEEAERRNSELARLYDAQLEQCRAGQQLVDTLAREKEQFTGQMDDMRDARERDVAGARAEINAEVASHRKTAAGADIAITDYRRMVLEVEEDLFLSRQNEGRITVLYEEAEEFAEILIWHQAPLIGLHEANTMALRSERLAHEQTTAELAQQMQRAQELDHEKGALIAELEAERSAQEKTALGAEHLARELESWRNDVKDTMLAEEIQTQAKLSRAQETEEQSAKIISLLKEEVAELKMQLSAAESKAAAEETDKTRLMQELRDHLEDAQRSSATEAKVRDELLQELQEARRKAQASDLLKEENFGGRLELLAVTVKMPPRLGGLSMDPASYAARLDEVTSHLAGMLQSVGDTRDVMKGELRSLREALESKNALITAKEAELSSKALELSTKEAELSEKQGELRSVEAALVSKAAEADDKEAALRQKEADACESQKTNSELKGIVEELSGRMNSMHGSTRKTEELEVVSAQQLKMLSEMSDNLNSAHQELAETKLSVSKQGELEEANMQLQDKLAQLEKELRNARVEEGVVNELAQRVQEFELQGEVSEGLVEAEARVRALEQHSKEEKEALQSRIRELESQLQPPKADPASSFYSTVKEPALPYAPRNLSPQRPRDTKPPPPPSENIWASSPRPKPYFAHNTSTATQSMHDWLNAYKRY